MFGLRDRVSPGRAARVLLHPVLRGAAAEQGGPVRFGTVWLECEECENEYEEMTCAMPPFRCMNCEVAAEDRFLDALDSTSAPPPEKP